MHEKKVVKIIPVPRYIGDYARPVLQITLHKNHAKDIAGDEFSQAEI